MRVETVRQPFEDGRALERSPVLPILECLIDQPQHMVRTSTSSTVPSSSRAWPRNHNLEPTTRRGRGRRPQTRSCGKRRDWRFSYPGNPAASASRSTWSTSGTLGLKISSSAPISRNASIRDRTSSAVRTADFATHSARSAMNA